LTSLISAPKVFQRVCQDKIFPYISFFGKGGGRSGTEPIRGYFLAFAIAIIFILIGNLNSVAPIISNFFLMAYTLINYSCFVASFTETPGWRPAFKYYNKWLSLFAAILCFSIMFIISWYTALPTVALVIALYGYVWYKKPDVNWGSSGQAFWYLQTMHGLKKLENMADHVKNYRPHLLLLSGRPSSRPDLVKFSSQIIGNNGIIICGDILKSNVTFEKQQSVQDSQTQWLKHNKIRAFYNSILSTNLHSGSLALYQMAGLGKLKPNTVLLGFKNNWKQASVGEVEEYMRIIQDAFEYNMGVCIFRLRAGFDTTEKSGQLTQGEISHLTLTPRPSVDVPTHKMSLSMESQPLLGRVEEDAPVILNRRVSSTSQPHASVYVDLEMSTYHKTSAVLSPEESTHASVNSYAAAMEEGELDVSDSVNTKDTPINPTYKVVTMPSRFSQKQGEGTIDIYWLYDDGGLSLLFPYLLSQDSKWSRSRLRIFTASSTRHIDSATLRMTTLLRKFRIDVSSVTELENLAKPSQERLVWKVFHQIVF
jgi:solute carrier family 12 sodium/potassium/chloride transporter 2